MGEMGTCYVCVCGGGSVVEALKTQTRLAVLDLRDNQISDRAARQLLPLIRALPSLQRVLLAGNPISGMVIGQIAMELDRKQ